MSQDDIRVVELFAGVGGFRLGLEKSSGRFTTVWANQWEPGKGIQHAFDCYISHFGDSSNHINEDIGKVKCDVPDHDLLVGGFPCQDYSVARTKAEGIMGKKGVLWWSMNDIIKAKHPKYILLENVDRLVRSPSTQRGRDFGIILRCLHDEGYSVEWRVINAAEYGEVQKRRRTFIFAYNKDTFLYNQLSDFLLEDILKKNGFFARSFPIGDPSADKVSKFTIAEDVYPTLVEVSSGFSGMFYNGGIMRNGVIYTRDCKPINKNGQRVLGDILVEDADEKYYLQDLSKWKYLKGAKRVERTRKSDGGKYWYSEGGIPFPDILTSPGRTMLTSEGTVNRSTHIIQDPVNDRYRKITPVECERMNGFDDGWTATGMPDSARYFTMGNALVVPLITKMGKTILEIID